MNYCNPLGQGVNYIVPVACSFFVLIYQSQTLTWGPRDVAATETVTIRLSARVSGRAGLGNLVNRAVMVAPSGAELSNIATATIRITPEAVFDCSDVIGKVFDDINRNGVQDPFDARTEVTDQEIFLDKYGKLAPPVPQDLLGEPGIPGVRIATVNGVLITTDEFGRFHVPCAALPADIGSNFTLKLDPRTLDRKSTRLNSSHRNTSRMPSSA